MKNLRSLMANGLWYGLSLPSRIAFGSAMKDVVAAQERLLLKILRRNARTEFGRRYHFDRIRSSEEYQRAVPLSSYDDYLEEVNRIAAGATRVLTSDRVLLFEPTSGSTAPSKQIPYTASLKAEFQRAISPWLVDLYSHDPALFRGEVYWSITPIIQRGGRTEGGVPIGFEEDTAYLGWSRRLLLQSILAVPSLVRRIDDIESFRYVTLLFLLRSRSLALISIWNPTFLLLIIRRLSTWWPRLAEDIAQGTLSPPHPIASSIHRSLAAINRPDPKRAAEIRALFESGIDFPKLHAALWPNLRVISCWTDGHAASFVPELKALFPQARIQGKGLIATEGIVSFPRMGSEGSLLAIRSHFFEFLPRGGGEAKRAHELERGEEYSVVLTTGGGFYRYRMRDLIQVVGHSGDCPLIRFLGKEDQISDWFGEKLDERHVRRLLERLTRCYSIRPAFAMVAIENASKTPAYCLFIEVDGVSNPNLIRMAAELEAGLRENYHYHYCRRLEQLGPLRIYRIDRGADEAYLSRCASFGQRIGSVKPVALHPKDGWMSWFRGSEICGDPSESGMTFVKKSLEG